MLDSGYDELKTWLEILEREAPALALTTCPESCRTIDGILSQAEAAKKLGYLATSLFFGRVKDNDLGFEFQRMAVEPKHAITLIKTMKKRYEKRLHRNLVR